MKGLDRRQFVRLALGGLAASTVPGCAAAAQTATVTPIPSPTRAHTPDAGRPVLRGENVPGFYVRYVKPFEAPDPDTWTLVVEGRVRTPQRLRLPDLLSLPLREQVSRMKCVECWSAAAKWAGLHLSSLLELVDPLPEARWVHFRCADGYYESLELEKLLGNRVLLVHHMNDELLPAIYGSPLRLMVPSLYGYKSAKAIEHIEFSPLELRGYWPNTGPYSTSGIIKGGRDHPLDLGGTRPIEGGGEIVYPDGREARPLNTDK